MAGSSPVDNLLDVMTQKIEDLTVGPSDQLAMRCLNRFDKKKVYGVGLETNIKFRTGKAGRIARATAGGALQVGQAPTAIAGKFGVKKMTLGFEWNDEDLKKMAGGRKGLHTTLGTEIQGGLDKFKLHQERLLYGDGSGVVARVDGDPGTATYFTFGPGPCLAIEDDEVEFVADRSTLADSGGESAAASRRVIKVDHAGKIVYLSAAIDTNVADNECLALAMGMITQDDSSNDKFSAYPMGFAGHLEHQGNDDGSAGVWDTGNASGYYCVEDYNNLTRTTAANVKMLCGHKAAASAPVSPYYISYGAAALKGQGVPTGELILVMSVNEYNRIVEMYSGAMLILPSAEITLPGGKTKLPVVTAAGQSNVGIIASPFMLDGAIATLHLGDYEQIFAPGGWVGEEMGSRLQLRPTASAATYDHVWQASMVMYWNDTCLDPNSQFLVSGLDVTDG